MSECGEVGRVCVSYTNLWSSGFTPRLTATLRSPCRPHVRAASWQMGSLYHTTLSSFSVWFPLPCFSRPCTPLHFQVPEICGNYLSNDSPLSVSFLVVGLDFLFLFLLFIYCNWKGHRQQMGSLLCSVRHLVPRCHHFSTIDDYGLLQIEKTSH